MTRRPDPPIDASVAARARRLAARRATAPAEPPPTLSHFARAGAPVRVECEACRRKRDAPAASWLARFGDVSLMEVERRAVCAACGERELIDARPLYERAGEGGSPPRGA